jgi:hypothetical protein
MVPFAASTERAEITRLADIDDATWLGLIESHARLQRSTAVCTVIAAAGLFALPTVFVGIGNLPMILYLLTMISCSFLAPRLLLQREAQEMGLASKLAAHAANAVTLAPFRRTLAFNSERRPGEDKLALRLRRKNERARELLAIAKSRPLR